MRLLAFGDLHGDWTTGGLERFDEADRALNQVHAYAVSRGVDRVLFLGDLTDPDVDAALAHRAVARILRFAVELRRDDVEADYLVGNHDVIEDGRGSHTLMALVQAGFRVWAKPGNSIVEKDGERIELVYLPYPSRGAGYDPDRYVRELAASHRIGMQGGSCVVLGHMTSVPGAAAGSETTDMPRGRLVPFPVEACEELRRVAGYARMVLLNGHFHQRAVDGPVLLPGATARFTHGEEGNEPGFLVIDA